MKLKHLIIIGATSILTSVLPVAAYATEVSTQSSKAVIPTASSIRTNAVVAQKQGANMSGNFVAAEKATTGMARIVTENGHRYLELDSAFSTSNQGPDLHVLLEPSEKPPMSYNSQNMGSYVNLGKLQKFKGTQRYPIPDSVQLENFKSVSIWCRMANATFGYAPLRASSTASTQ